LITWFTAGHQRLAIGATACFFMLGLWWLWPLDMAKGRARVTDPGADR